MSDPSIAKKQILLVDDHPVMRFGLAQLIRFENDMAVVAEAGTAREAVQIVVDQHPDLVVVDISLPDKSGIELIKDLRALNSDVKMLVVSMHDEEVYTERALRAGARGYVMKEEAADKLIEAIRVVLSGGVFVSEKMSRRIVELFSGLGTAAAADDPMERLTDRELEVFELLGAGLGSKEIADRIQCSPRTVDAHRAHIREKLCLRDSKELMLHAVRWAESRA
ncbi:MAG: response regulator transcription factor [Verrucomicrobiae bacterium]|nr:response regulator transcription factor [Verrucomicrobiae bacterium]